MTVRAAHLGVIHPGGTSVTLSIWQSPKKTLNELPAPGPSCLLPAPPARVRVLMVPDKPIPAEAKKKPPPK